eukprot:583487-Prymnesium_polylepis.1
MPRPRSPLTHTHGLVSELQSTLAPELQHRKVEMRYETWGNDETCADKSNTQHTHTGEAGALTLPWVLGPDA